MRHTLYTDHSLHRPSCRSNNHHPLCFLIDVKIIGIAILVLQILPKAQFRPITIKMAVLVLKFCFGLSFILQLSKWPFWSSNFYFWDHLVPHPTWHTTLPRLISENQRLLGFHDDNAETPCPFYLSLLYSFPRTCTEPKSHWPNLSPKPISCPRLHPYPSPKVGTKSCLNKYKWHGGWYWAKMPPWHVPNLIFLLVRLRHRKEVLGMLPSQGVLWFQLLNTPRLCS